MKLILEGLTVADLAAEAKRFLVGVEGSQRQPERPTTAEPEPPLPDAPPPDLFAEAQRVFEQQPQCPTHGPMKRYPPGTNKAGKHYNASWRCATRDCPTKAIWDKDAA